VKRRARDSGFALALAGTVLAAALPAGAQELRIEVFADRPQPAVDDLVRLTYKLSGSGLTGDIKPPSPFRSRTSRSPADRSARTRSRSSTGSSAGPSA